MGGDLQTKKPGGDSLVAEMPGNQGAGTNGPGVGPGKQTLTAQLSAKGPATKADGDAKAAGPTDAQVAAAVTWGQDAHHGPGPETLAALQTALGVAKSTSYDEALARAVFVKQQALKDKQPDGKAGPNFCGQISVAFAKAKPAKKPEAGKGDDQGKLHLQTALDSKVTVSKVGAAYLIALDMAKLGQCIEIGEYESIAKDPSLHELPIGPTRWRWPAR